MEMSEDTNGEIATPAMVVQGITDSIIPLPSKEIDQITPALEQAATAQPKTKVGISRKREASTLSNRSNLSSGTRKDKKQLGINISSENSKLPIPDKGGDKTNETNRFPRKNPEPKPKQDHRSRSGDNKPIDLKTKVESKNIIRPSTVSNPSEKSNVQNSRTSSMNSLMHKPGQMPAYYHKTDKSSLMLQMTAKKTKFSQIKKELKEIQTKALESYNQYIDVQQKLNKLTGKDVAPFMTELKLVGFEKEKGKDFAFLVDKCEGIIPKTNSKEENGAEKKPISFDKLKSIQDQGLFDVFVSKMTTISETGFKLCQELIDLAASAQGSESGDFKNYPEQISNIFKTKEEKIIEEEKQQVERINSFFTELKNMLINEDGVPVMKRDDLDVEYSKYKQDNETKMNELLEANKDLELKYKQIINKNKEDEENYSTQLDKIKNLTDKLSSLEKTIAEKDKELEKLSQKIKTSDTSNKKLEKLLESKADDLASKKNAVTEMEKHKEQIEEKLKVALSDLNSCEKKIMKNEKDFQLKLKQLQTQLDNEMQQKPDNESLQKITKEDQINAEKLKALGEENKKLKSSEKSLLTEVENLKKEIEKLHIECKTFKSELKHDRYQRNEIEQQNEIEKLKSNISGFQAELSKRDAFIIEKTQLIRELEQNIIYYKEQIDGFSSIQAEMFKYRDLEKKRTTEIQLLQSQLASTTLELKKQEESLFMQQRLLHIRSALINSLQENEQTTKSHISDLYSKLDKNSSIANQMNQDLSAKAEELQNLFSTLGSKQLEVTRQNDIIKTLKESNERNQRSRLRLEEKIARLEHENSELKRFIMESGIALYTNPVVPPFEPILYREMVVTPTTDNLNSKFDKFVNVDREIYYQCERRKKRQIERSIKVKKYNF